MSLTVNFDYKPLRIFHGFHTATTRTRLIVGGYGSGKSTALCAEAIALGFEHPGAEFLVMRKTVPSLAATTERIFIGLLPQEFLDQCEIKRAGNHLNYIRFPNGSLYWFRGCDDWKKHRSMNLAFIVWDEADEFSPEDFDGLQSRVRQETPTPEARRLGHKRITRNGNILACNPWGHNWIWQYFVDEHNSKHRFDSACWISTSFDNPYLPVATLQAWLAMPDPWVRRFVLCSFDDFAGAIYPEWSYDTHVIEPFKSSTGAYLYDKSQGWFRMGFDPGSGTVHPLTGDITGSLNAGLWVYYDPKTDRLVGVAEYAEGNLPVRKHTRNWRMIEAKHGMNVQRRIADPGSINNRDRGSNNMLSDLYRRNGFNFALGPQRPADRVWGLGELIASGRFVLTNECQRTFEQIRSYRWEDLTPTQLDKGADLRPLKKDVDLVDAAQYATTHYVAPKKVHAAAEELAPEDLHAREIHALIKKQIQRGRRKNAQVHHDLGNMCI